MKLQRFFGEFNFKDKEIVISNYEVINQIKNVFRYQKGKEVLLLDNLGNEALVEIRKINSEEIIFEIKKVQKNENMPKNKVALYSSILKKENFELVVQKATEVGVSEIYPLLSARTVKQNVKENRLLKIIKEASEQSERGTIPILHETINFKNAIKNIDKKELNIMFDHSGEPLSTWTSNTQTEKINPVKSCCTGIHKDELFNRVNIFIGPEGGWAEEEIVLAKESDLKIVSLGKLNLRGETASIIGSYLAVNM